jgi:hypothetical protein
MMRWVLELPCGHNQAQGQTHHRQDNVSDSKSGSVGTIRHAQQVFEMKISKDKPRKEQSRNALRVSGLAVRMLGSPSMCL